MNESPPPFLHRSQANEYSVRQQRVTPVRQRPGEDGIALILVTSTIAILALLIVGFLALIKTEHGAAEAFADGVEVRNLAEVPVNLAIGQLRMATERNGTTRTWASQPGAIRIYGTQTDPTTGRAELERVYKLYSAEEMVVEGAAFDPSAEVPPSGWQDKAGLYTDLNERVAVDLDGDGSPVYEYPILNPNAFNKGIKGFEIERVPGVNQMGRGAGPLMPVRWLYVLEDGSLVSPTGQNGDEVEFGADGPTAENPIASRVAFWTDDETSKVNINTASDGIFWDVPRANTHRDAFGYADKQPVRNEFQRYPGHPATTNLNAVLNGYLGDDPEAYFGLTPYVQNGGSMAGTVEVNETTVPVDLDDDRLYASVDEYIFDASAIVDGLRGVNHSSLNRQMLDETKFFLTAHSRAPEVNLFNKPRISIWPVQEDPQDRNAVDRVLAFCAQTRPGGTSTLPYYFQRESVHDLGNPQTGYGSSQSPTADMQITRNQDLWNYLRKLMESGIPGFGKTFLEKYPLDRDQIATQIVDYLRSGLNTMAVGLATERDSRGYFYSAPRQVAGIGAALGEGQVIPLEIGNTRGFGRSVTVTEAALIIYPVDAETDSNRKVDVPSFSEVPILRAKQVRAFMLLEFFTATPGLPSWSPYLNIEIQGLENFSLGGSSLKMPASAKVLTHTPIGFIPRDNGRYTGAGHSTAHMSLFQPLFTGNNSPRNYNSTDPKTGYAWHSTAPVNISVSEETLPLTGGAIKIIIRNHDESAVVQTVNMNFPDTTVPAPYVWVHPERKVGPPPSDPSLPDLRPPDPLDYETDLKLRVEKTVGEYDTFLIRPGDVVRSVEADSTAPPKGDFRFYAVKKDVPADWFTKGGKPGEYDDPEARFALGLRNGNFWQYWGHFRTRWNRESGDDAIDSRKGTGDHNINPYWRDSSHTVAGSLVAELGKSPADGKPFHTYRDAAFVCGRGIEYAARKDLRPGDWDNGFGNNEDGCYINKPDETNGSRKYWNWGNFYHSGGYFSRGSFDIDQNAVNHSPNRQIASPVMMGSLPTGIVSERPWETLLFCANPAGRTTPATAPPTVADHIGFSFPRDHLLLDFFWMPVAEPYAISEPFSTGGKVNMNYDILPFRYIKRRSAVHAVLESIEPMAIHPRAAQRTGLGCHKGGRDQAHAQELRYSVDLDHETGTLKGFEKRFNEEGDLFRSASELCDIFIVPEPLESPTNAYPPEAGNPTYDQMVTWWQQFTITADNMREMPYNYAVGRLTTKSNTFTVHYRVQHLKKVRSTEPDVFVEGRDEVVAEHRGSTLIERYVDPNDPGLPDFATESFAETSIDPYYRIRVVRRKQFAP